MSRLTSLDVFRGMTVAGMLVVNNPGSWSHIYPPLRHAEWHGWTATDLIFPFFLFIVGVTTHLSLEGARRRGATRRELVRKILKRGVLIVLIGLALNAFPFFTWAAVGNNPDPTFLDRVSWRFAHLRFPGVLQRIGIVYMLTALLSLVTTQRQQIQLAAALLIGYWLAMTVVPVPDSGILGIALLDRPGETLAAWLDRAVFGVDHLWASAKTWDPEGILSTIPAIATAILGLLTGDWLGRTREDEERHLTPLFASGGLVACGGLVWNWFFPINKNLWTSSYVLLTGGLAMLTLATLIWVIEIRGWRRGIPPFAAFGLNPMLAFVLSGVVARLIVSLVKVDFEGKRIPLQAAVHRTLFASWMEPRLASLAYALTFTAAFLLILWPLYKRNIIWKV